MACISKRRNRWVIDFYDTNGRRRWITLPKGSTKRTAKEKLREIEDRIKSGVYIPKNKIPLFRNVAYDFSLGSVGKKETQNCRVFNSA
jgi:hypothetical protein